MITPIRTLTAGSVEVSECSDSDGRWFTFFIKGGGRLSCLPHELSRIAALAQSLAAEEAIRRQKELERMKRPARRSAPLSSHPRFRRRASP